MTKLKSSLLSFFLTCFLLTRQAFSASVVEDSEAPLVDGVVPDEEVPVGGLILQEGSVLVNQAKGPKGSLIPFVKGNVWATTNEIKGLIKAHKWVDVRNYQRKIYSIPDYQRRNLLALLMKSVVAPKVEVELPEEEYKKQVVDAMQAIVQNNHHLCCQRVIRDMEAYKKGIKTRKYKITLDDQKYEKNVYFLGNVTEDFINLKFELKEFGITKNEYGTVISDWKPKEGGLKPNPVSDFVSLLTKQEFMKEMIRIVHPIIVHIAKDIGNKVGEVFDYSTQRDEYATIVAQMTSAVAAA